MEGEEEDDIVCEEGVYDEKITYDIFSGIFRSGI